MTSTTNTTAATTALPIVSFAKGFYTNRFGGTTEFNHHGRMQAIQAAYSPEVGWVFKGIVIDADWQTELAFNADPQHKLIAEVSHSSVLSHGVDELVSEISSKATSLSTEDGYRFTRKTDQGMWTDGDLGLGPSVREYEAIAAILLIDQPKTDIRALLEGLKRLGFVPSTGPDGLPALKLAMPSEAYVLVSESAMVSNNPSHDSDFKISGHDSRDQTLMYLVASVDTLNGSIREVCRCIYSFGLGLIDGLELVSECRGLVLNRLQERLGFAATMTSLATDRALLDSLHDYVHTTMEAGKETWAEIADDGEKLEVATMQSLGWQVADGVTKDQIVGARYQRTFGGPHTPFVGYAMTIVQAEDGWIPMHGGVRMPTAPSPVDAANVLTQFWVQLPVREKLSIAVGQSRRDQ